ncbi:hypothetical protein B0H10DRAFT_1951252 [Mycena sp. CBHHK59/15]|nr:hypothetical protein B0H10DRAFT_1951252 [Mycena sp. CBHHK59/15]
MYPSVGESSASKWGVSGGMSSDMDEPYDGSTSSGASTSKYADVGDSRRLQRAVIQGQGGEMQRGQGLAHGGEAGKDALDVREAALQRGRAGRRRHCDHIWYMYGAVRHSPGIQVVGVDDGKSILSTGVVRSIPREANKNPRELVEKVKLQSWANIVLEAALVPYIASVKSQRDATGGGGECKIGPGPGSAEAVIVWASTNILRWFHFTCLYNLPPLSTPNIQWKVLRSSARCLLPDSWAFGAEAEDTVVAAGDD